MDAGEIPGRLTAVVVDDERLARRDLIAMLAKHANIVVVGEADDVRSAARQIARLSPDVVFLDIQMPGESGFDLLEKADVRAHVVFVTAYDEYAVRAFEVNALDYLLKPVSPDRLARSIERLVSAERSPEPGTGKLHYEDSLFIRLDSRMKFLKVSSIVAITAAGDYTEVLTADKGRHLADKPMSEWQARLPAAGFCRIHRSAIVNLAYVERVEETSRYSYNVHLRGQSRPLPMSRRYAKGLGRRMK
jgi:two-component system LytT family response regulator